MEFITTNTQKKIKIIPATFREQLTLKNEFWNILKDNPDIANIMQDKGNSLETAIKGILLADTSDKFISAVFQCLKGCLYEDIRKIDELLFEDVPELREDYYEIIFECCKVNLTPFFKSLGSAFIKVLDEVTKQENLKQE